MYIYEHIFQWFKYLNIENITFPLYFTVLYVLNEINSDASNYVIKFVCELRQVGGVPRFPPLIKRNATI
jgi:hypothetical protein